MKKEKARDEALTLPLARGTGAHLALVHGRIARIPAPLAARRRGARLPGRLVLLPA